MNGLAIAVSLAGVAAHAGLAIFFYGRLTQKVEGHDSRISHAESKVEQHHGEIGVLYGRTGLQR